MKKKNLGCGTIIGVFLLIIFIIGLIGAIGAAVSGSSGTSRSSKSSKSTNLYHTEYDSKTGNRWTYGNGWGMFTDKNGNSIIVDIDK